MPLIKNALGILSKEAYNEFLEYATKEFGNFDNSQINLFKSALLFPPELAGGLTGILKDYFSAEKMPYSYYENLIQYCLEEIEENEIDNVNTDLLEEIKLGGLVGISQGIMSYNMDKRGELPMKLDEDPYFAHLFIGVDMNFLAEKITNYKKNQS